MKKIVIIIAITILIISLSIFIFLQVKININENNNNLVISQFNDIFNQSSLTISDDEINLSKLEINDTDYIGIITIEKDNLSLPVESECNNKILSLQSTCRFNNSTKTFTIIGTTFKDSLVSYKNYDIDDKIVFTNTLGETFQYKIKKIKRLNKLNDVKKYESDLIIIIKNYYDMEYILYICESY